MAQFSVSAIRHAEALDLQHLAGWNAIAKDPGGAGPAPAA